MIAAFGADDRFFYVCLCCYLNVLDAVRMEYAWTEANIVMEFVTVSMEVMKRTANHLQQRMYHSLLQSFDFLF